MRFIKSMLGWLDRCPSDADGKYHSAMAESHDVLQQMKEAPNDPARDIVADILLHRHNIPYMTTLFEAFQEMNASVKQRLN